MYEIFGYLKNYSYIYQNEKTRVMKLQSIKMLVGVILSSCLMVLILTNHLQSVINFKNDLAEVGAFFILFFITSILLIGLFSPKQKS